jgi:hypothetical protein
MPVMPGWPSLRAAARAAHHQREMEEAKRRALARPLEARWQPFLQRLQRDYPADHPIWELLGQSVEPRQLILSTETGLLPAHFNLLVLLSLSRHLVGQVVARRDLLDLVSEHARPKSATSRGQHGPATYEALNSALATMRSRGWCYFDGKQVRGDVLVLATLAQPPSPDQREACTAGNWRLEPDALVLHGHRAEDALLRLSPIPTVLPSSVRPKRKRALSARELRLDAELRALAKHLTDPPVPVPAWVEAKMAGNGPLNFVDYIHRGVMAHKAGQRDSLH